MNRFFNESHFRHLRIHLLCFFAIFSSQKIHFTIRKKGHTSELDCKLLYFVSGFYSYELRQLFKDISRK